MNNNNNNNMNNNNNNNMNKFSKNEREVEINNIQRQNLLRIKPCHFVVRKDNNKFGVCYREECSFAHSLNELNIPKCIFGDDCKKIYATWDYNLGINDSNKKCEFKHPFESNEEYFNRTKIRIPDLPKTHEHSRKPMKDVKKEEVKKDVKKEVQVESSWGKPLNTDKLKNQITETVNNYESKVETKPTDCVKIMVPKDFVEKAIESAIKMGVLNFEIIII